MHQLAEILKFPKQVKIVGYLSAAPLRAHSRLEISKRLHMTEPHLGSALSALVATGWLRIIQKGEKEFYLFNLKYAPAASLHQAVLAGKKIPSDDFFEAIVHLGKVKAVFLSGFLVGQPHLPVDILLIGSVNPERLNRFLAASNLLFGQELNYTIMNPEEFRLRRNTFDRFIKDIFDHPYLTVLDKLT